MKAYFFNLGHLLPTLPGFKRIRFPLHTLAGVSEKMFQGVTLSFHLSDYQFAAEYLQAAPQLFTAEQVAPQSSLYIALS